MHWNALLTTVILILFQAVHIAAAKPPGEPTLFSLAVPEGNHRVTITFGDEASEADLTVKAEARRLMIENGRTKPGEFATRAFVVNVRTSKIAGGESVQLKDREKDSLTWDEKLTLEFNGSRPSVRTVEITPASDDVVTVYLAGDSTVTDQRSEPYAGWGQMLPRFFNADVAVANHAESGEALRSFANAKRLAKILSQIKPGDYLFIQFGHNDMKEKGEGVGAFTSFSESLRQFVSEARKSEAIPVLLTPMNRRRFDESARITNTHDDYPEAVRRVAKELDVPLIDLHAMSKTLYEVWGPEESKKAFVHYPSGTFPGQDQPLKDDSHFNAYGGYELARCVVEGIRANKLALAKSIAHDIGPFDPAKPDPIESIKIPPSPIRGPTTAPAGR